MDVNLHCDDYMHRYIATTYLLALSPDSLNFCLGTEVLRHSTVLEAHMYIHTYDRTVVRCPTSIVFIIVQ